MTEFFAQVGDFFTNTWNENPGYIYAAGGVLLAVILAIIIGCAVSKRKKKAAAAKNEEPAETSAVVREEEVSGAPRAVETTAQPAAETAGAEDAAPANESAATAPAAERAPREAQTSAPAKAPAAANAGEKKQSAPAPQQRPAAQAKPAQQKPAAQAQAPAKTAETNGAAKKNDHSAIYHVTRRKEDGKWQVKYAKGAKAIKLFDTQAEAAAFARKIADNCDGSVVIHKVTGQIRKLKEKLPETPAKNREQNENEEE